MSSLLLPGMGSAGSLYKANILVFVYLVSEQIHFPSKCILMLTVQAHVF